MQSVHDDRSQLKAVVSDTICFVFLTAGAIRRRSIPDISGGFAIIPLVSSFVVVAEVVVIASQNRPNRTLFHRKSGVATFLPFLPDSMDKSNAPIGIRIAIAVNKRIIDSQTASADRVNEHD